MAEYPEYGLNERPIGLISSASAMHDVGKLVVPDGVLNQPGRLTTEEFEIIKTHTTAGSEILERFDRVHREEYFTYATVICRHHHERWDGKGYPDGLVGDDIPISAQAVGVADCYDALTTDRVYKPAFSHETAMEMILSGQCGVFSEKIKHALVETGPEFDRLAKAYPDGSLTSKITG